MVGVVFSDVLSGALGRKLVEAGVKAEELIAAVKVILVP
jgi:hypothetical protein